MKQPLLFPLTTKRRNACGSTTAQRPAAPVVCLLLALLLLAMRLPAAAQAPAWQSARALAVATAAASTNFSHHK